MVGVGLGCIQARTRILYVRETGLFLECPGTFISAPSPSAKAFTLSATYTSRLMNLTQALCWWYSRLVLLLLLYLFEYVPTCGREDSRILAKCLINYFVMYPCMHPREMLATRIVAVFAMQHVKMLAMHPRKSVLIDTCISSQKGCDTFCMLCAISDGNENQS